ncbi:MAG: polyketide cyclase [Chitinophagaceae bacterium]|nr:MAG: polyketide cyclase [Chitinophagaceae bacterium]
MLIRKPVQQVFNAFIDPEYTKNFWFTKSSGKLEEGKTVIWEWEMYGVSTEVNVRIIEDNKRIAIDWEQAQTQVEFNFEAKSELSTYIIIRQSGFKSEGAALFKELIDTTGGFTTVVDGLKAYLEHGINLNLIADKFADK